jgi:hypothetical protein
MTALAVTDLDGDGNKEIVVGMKTGWLRAYDHKGNELWFQKCASSVRSIAALTGGRFAVGFANGELTLFNGAGKAVKTAQLDSGVEILRAAGNSSCLAGTKKGTVACLVGGATRTVRR